MKKLLLAFMLIGFIGQAQSFDFDCETELFTERFPGFYATNNYAQYVGKEFLMSAQSIVSYNKNYHAECYSVGENILTFDNDNVYTTITEETENSLSFSINNGRDDQVFNFIERNGVILLEYISTGNNTRYHSYTSTNTLENCDCSHVPTATVEVDDKNSIPNDRKYILGETILLTAGRSYTFSMGSPGTSASTIDYINGVRWRYNKIFIATPTFSNTGTIKRVNNMINFGGIDCSEEYPEFVWNYKIIE